MQSDSVASFFNSKFLKLLEARALYAKRVFLGSRQGGHVSPKKGHGIEFSDYRQYQLGDSPRDIDWGVYARSDRLYVKRFQEEEDITCLTIIDPSASMIDFPTKKFASRVIALALSYIALLSHDTVILSGGKNFRTTKLKGGKSFARLLSLTEKTCEKGSLKDEISHAASRIKFPGMCFIISDFLIPLEEIFESINILRAKNLDVTLICVRDSLDENPYADGIDGKLRDSETQQSAYFQWDDEIKKGVQEEVKKHDSAIQKYAQEAHITLLEHRTHKELHEFTLQTLVKSNVIR